MRWLPCSLVVTVYNEAQSIGRLLHSVLSQSARPLEFIVVDGGSIDSTTAQIESFVREHRHWAKLVVDPTCATPYTAAPIAKGRNLGISIATQEIIAVTDAGCHHVPDWLERIVDPIIKGEADCVGGIYEILYETRWGRYFALMYQPSETDLRNFIPSARSFAFRKELWERVRGYPTGCKYGEDTEFVLRLLRIGARMRLEPRAKVFWRPDGIDRWGGGVRLVYRYAEGDGWRLLFLRRRLLRVAYYASPLLFLGVGLSQGVLPPDAAWMGIGLFSLWLVSFLVRTRYLFSARPQARSPFRWSEFGVYVLSLNVGMVVGYLVGLLKRVVVASRVNCRE